MARFRFDPRSVAGVHKQFKLKTAKMQRKAAHAMVNWAIDTVGEIKREIIKVGAFDTGDLHGSVTYSPPRKVGKGKIRLFILANKEYAPIVEFGRRPRRGKAPPLKVLVGWAKRKGMLRALPVNVDLGRYRKEWGAAKKIRENSFKVGSKRRRKKKSVKALNPIIKDFLVLLGLQEGIQQRGIKGRKPFTRAFNRRRKGFRREIVRFVRRRP